MKVHGSFGEAVLFKGEKVAAVNERGNWIISGKYKVASGGKLFAPGSTTIASGMLTGKGRFSSSKAVSVSGSLRAEDSAKTLPQSISEWNDLYYERCSTCHKAYDPSAYPCRRWPAIIDSMKVQAGLSKSEALHVLRYLQLSARAAKHNSPY